MTLREQEPWLEQLQTGDDINKCEQKGTKIGKQSESNRSKIKYLWIRQ
jgi:hypothetical protein